MSKSSLIDSDEVQPDDPLEALEEHRELFERIADADLPASEHFRRALERADAMEDDDAE